MVSTIPKNEDQAIGDRRKLFWEMEERDLREIMRMDENRLSRRDSRQFRGRMS
jgi:hypothetical protein